VFLMAALIRLIPIFRYQFSYDELSALSRTTYANWHDLLTYGAQVDAHPVLIQCFLFALVKVVGYSEVWIKLPFICFSLGTIVYAYLFALKWFGKTPALLSSVIFSFSFIFIYYSPLARMYASGLFFSTAFMYYWFMVLFEAVKTKHYVWMAVFILLSALNSHIGCLFVLTCGLTGLFIIKKRKFFKYILFCAVTVILYLPHLSITLFQLDYGGIGASQDGWLAAPDKWVVFSLMKTLLGTGYIWLFFIMSLVVSFVINKTEVDKKALLLLVLFFVNYGIIHTYSILVAPIFQYSVMLFSSPCFVWGFTSLYKGENKWMQAFVVIAAFALCFQSLYIKAFYRNCVKNQDQFQYDNVVSLQKKHGNNSVTAVFFDTEKLFMLLYETKHKHKINYYLGSDTVVVKADAFRQLLRNSKANYLVLGKASPANIELCKEFFPYIAYSVQNSNINYCELSKTPPDRKFNRVFNVLDSSDYFTQGNYEFNLNKDVMNIQNKDINYRVDSLNEFPFMVKAAVGKISSKEGQVVLATAMINSNEKLNDAGLHFSVVNQKDSTLFFSGTEMKPFYNKDPLGYKVYTELYLGTEYQNWKQGSVKCFFWNRSKQKFVIRNFKIETVDYWPLKWNLWE
jgi:hypothetical protein